MKLEVLHEGSTPFQRHLALQVVMRVFLEADVTLLEVYRAEADLLAWDDTESDEPFHPTPEQRKALDALCRAQRAADGALGIKDGQPASTLDWVES